MATNSEPNTQTSTANTSGQGLHRQPVTVRPRSGELGAWGGPGPYLVYTDPSKTCITLVLSACFYPPSDARRFWLKVESTSGNESIDKQVFDQFHSLWETQAAFTNFRREDPQGYTHFWASHTDLNVADSIVRGFSRAVATKVATDLNRTLREGLPRIRIRKSEADDEEEAKWTKKQRSGNT